MATRRCCPDAFFVTRGGYVERTDATGREFPVQNRDSDLRHVMCPFVGPAHLLLLGYVATDDLIHRGLGDAADRQVLTMSSAVVDQRVRIFCQVPGDSVQLPPQRVEFVPSLVSSRKSNALIRSTALLPLRCQTNHLAWVISVSTDSRSIESIILLPNTGHCAT